MKFRTIKYMRTKLTKVSLVLAIILIASACKDNNADLSKNIQQYETTETDFFSVEYNYFDTIRLSSNTKGYVDIVVSSDNEYVLKSYLTKYEHYIITGESTREEIKMDQISDQNNDIKQNITKDDMSEMPKIGVEIIGVEGAITEFEIGCRQIKTSFLSSMQKISVNPTPWYYEYSSKVHDYYGKIKYTNIASNGAYIPFVRVRYGYKKCMLCKVITWKDGEYRGLYETSQYDYDDNAFGYNGTHYIPGTNIYRLYTGVLSYSPDNFWIKFSENPIANW